MNDVMEKIQTKHTEAPAKKEKVKVKKVLIICSKGKIEDVYAALVMAKCRSLTYRNSG